MSLILPLVLYFSLPTFGVGVLGALLNLAFLCFFSIQLLLHQKIKLIKKHSLLAVVIFYSILQILLSISAFNEYRFGRESLSSVLSVFRPVMLLVFILYFRNFFLTQKKSPEFFLDGLIRSLLWLAVLMILLEFSLPNGRSIFEMLYGSRPIPYVFSMATSYYASYVIFFCFLFYYSHVFLGVRKKGAVGYMLLCVLILALCQSKPPIAGCAALLLFLFFKKKPFMSVSFALVATLMFSRFLINLDFFDSQFYVIRSFYLLATTGFEHSTLAPRIHQIYLAFEGSSELNFFGIGLAREILMESWIAYITYRYGIIGFLIYTFFWMVLVVSSFLSFKRTSSLDARKPLFLMLSIWFFSQIALNLSGGMFEIGFTSIIFCLSLGLYVSIASGKSIAGRSDQMQYHSLAGNH